MTPKEALDRIRLDPGDGEAWRVVDELLRVLVARITDDAALREGAVVSVRRKLEDQACDGDLDEILAPRAYLSKQLRWRVYDVLRKRKREQQAAERAREAPPPPAQEPEVLSSDVLAVMETVVERAVARRDPWQRDHLRRAWDQIRRLHLEDVTLRAIVVADEALDAADGDAVEKAVQRAHKAHQRARAALLEALDGLVDHGRIDPDSAELARTAIGRLKRRQDRAPPSVSKAARKNS